MSTKKFDLSLPGKSTNFNSSFSNHNDQQYSNLNLNENHQSAEIDPFQSESKSFQENVRRKVDDFGENNSKTKNHGFNSWSKHQKSQQYSSSFLNEEKEPEKQWKKNDSKSNPESSTLSLHITAYENSIEASNIVNTTTDKISTASKNAKLIISSLSSSTSMTSFEIPRQQTDQPNELEIMNFKASQKLFDLNSAQNEAINRLAHPAGTKCSPTCKSVSKVLSVLNAKYPLHTGNLSLTEVDHIAAKMVECNLLDIVRSGKIPQSFYDLEIKGSDLIDDSDDSQSECSSDESDSDEEFVPHTEKKSLPYPMNKMKAILDLYDDKKFSGNKLKRVQKRFRCIKDAKQIWRIRQQVRQGGTRNYKAKELREQLFQEFLRWKSEKQVIRDRFLVDSALEIAERLKYDTFKASPSWLFSFKRRFGIVGRKITQVVSIKNPHEAEDIEKTSSDFVDRVKLTIETEKIPPSKVYNSDQMGIQLEMRSGRTLAFKGEKQVQVSSELMKDWMKEILIPNVPSKSLLLLDSWTGFNQAKEMPELKKKKINILTIPKKTTGKVQPLDVGHNRYTKAFYRTMSDKLRRIRPKFMLSKRKNIGRLLNQSFEQFAAPRFKPLVQHAFIKAGYFDSDYESYQTPDDYCFNYSKVGAKCEISGCDKFAFLRCAWCEKYLCVDDFLMKLHCCRNDNEI